MTASGRIIKRYANRKLYDTRDSRYVTLDQIAEMIRDGEDVRVVENTSKEDLTSVTLAQIIFEQEKRQRSFLPLSALRKVIQSGGESLHDLVSQLQESAGRVGRVFRRDEASPESDDAPAPESPSPPVAEALSRPEQEGQEKAVPVRMLREFIDGVQHTIDEWQKRLDANLHSALETVSPWAPLQKEIQGLRDRIGQLENKLREIEGPAPVDGDGGTGEGSAAVAE